MDQTSPAPTLPVDPAEQLRRRLDSVEAELRGLAVRLDPTAEVRGVGLTLEQPAGDLTRMVTLPSPLLRVAVPSYLAATLTQAEEALLQRDAALHAGEDDIARGLEERVAGVVCAALRRAEETFWVPAGVDLGDMHNAFLRGGNLDNIDLTLDEFRTQELAVLRLVGLSVELATTHLDEALSAFRASTITIRTEQDLRNALGTAASAACATQLAFVEARRVAEDAQRAAESRRRRRRRLRRGVFALGGALIAIANPMALPLLGPLPVAVSIALGSGAAGAAANLIED